MDESYNPADDPAGLVPVLVCSVPRSPHWGTVRAAHLKKQPACAACGARTALEVHHIEPFHLKPEKELDPDNLITLCQCPSHNCHLIFGHLLNWTLFNPSVIQDATVYRDKMRKARGQ